MFPGNSVAEDIWPRAWFHPVLKPLHVLSPLFGRPFLFYTHAQKWALDNLPLTKSGLGLDERRIDITISSHVCFLINLHSSHYLSASQCICFCFRFGFQSTSPFSRAAFPLSLRNHCDRKETHSFYIRHGTNKWAIRMVGKWELWEKRRFTWPGPSCQIKRHENLLGRALPQEFRALVPLEVKRKALRANPMQHKSVLERGYSNIFL